MFPAKYNTWSHYDPFSQIVHAISHGLEGPYVQVEEISDLGPYHCSPAVVQIRTSDDPSAPLYVLYWSGQNKSDPGTSTHPNEVHGATLTVATTTDLDQQMKVIATNTSNPNPNPEGDCHQHVEGNR